MPQKALVVVLALFALVGAGWLAFGGGSAEPAPAPLTVTPAPTAAGEVDAVSADGKTPAAAVAANGGTTAGDPARVAVATDDAAAAKVTVRGRLVDRKQQPRGGVVLRLASWEGLEFDFGGPFDGPDRDDRLPKTTSASDGRFTFPVVRGRQGQLRLDGQELVFAKGSVTFLAKSDVDLGDVEVQAACRIAGVVRDGNGQPVADVKVGVTTDGLGFGMRSQATTAADGAFEVAGLSPGQWQLRTASGKFLPATVPVTLTAEERKVDVVIQVAPGKAVAGQVVDDRGVPVAGIKVGSNRKETRGDLAIDRFSPDEATVTDANGYFTLANLEGEAVAVRAFGKGYTAASESHVAVGTGNLLLRVQRLATVSGVLRDGTGKPIAGSRVSAGARGGPGEMLAVEDGALPMPDGMSMVTTAADGTFTLDGVRPGTVIVRANGKAHRPAKSQPLTLQPAQKLDGIALVADSGATAHVHVTDEQGKPVAKAKVTVKRPAQDEGGVGMVRRAVRIGADDDNGDVHVFGGDEALGTATTDAEGDADVAGLPAGAVAIAATHEDFAEAVPALLTLPATGVVESKLVMRLPGFAAVAVTTPDGAAATTAAFVVHGPIGQGTQERDRDGKTGADGAARVGPLPAGDYWAELQLPAQARSLGGASIMIGGDRRALHATRTPFRVDAGQTSPVALRMPVLTRVHGTVTGGDGPAAGIAIELEKAPDAAAAGEQGIPDFGALEARTGDDGTYSIDNVEAGNYRIHWGKPEQIVKASAPLAVAANVPEQRKDLALTYGKLELQAVAKGSGDGIEGAEVELDAQDGVTDEKTPRPQRRVMMIATVSAGDGGGGESTTMTMGAQRAKTDVDGKAELVDVPPGTYTVRIKDGRYAARELRNQVVNERATTDCGRVELEAAGRVRGKVLDADGKQTGFAMVRYQKVGASGEPEREPAMGGAFTLNGLAAGRYRVFAESLGAEQPQPGPAQEIDVVAGKVQGNIELRLPAAR